MDVDLNVKPKTVKLLAGDIGENFCGLGLCKDFLVMTPKAQTLK